MAYNPFLVNIGLILISIFTRSGLDPFLSPNKTGLQSRRASSRLYLPKHPSTEKRFEDNDNNKNNKWTMTITKSLLSIKLNFYYLIKVGLHN